MIYAPDAVPVKSACVRPRAISSFAFKFNSQPSRISPLPTPNMKATVVYAAALLVGSASGQKSNPYLTYTASCPDATNSASSR